MGYRSEVAIAFTDHAVRLLNAIMEHESAMRTLVGECENTINMNEEDKGGKLHWCDIKWYEGYPEIDRMESLLQQIPDEDYHFIRLGEESHDIEERGGFYGSDMYVQRAIAW